MPPLALAAPQFSDLDMDAVLRAVERELAKPVAPSRPDKTNVRMSKRALRKYPFHDLEVGQSCRVPNSVGLPARNAAYVYGHETGRKFKTQSHANGFWIKRVA